MHKDWGIYFQVFMCYIEILIQTIEHRKLNIFVLKLNIGTKWIQIQ
jgi:hypothetical protein